MNANNDRRQSSLCACDPLRFDSPPLYHGLSSLIPPPTLLCLLRHTFCIREVNMSASRCASDSCKACFVDGGSEFARLQQLLKDG